MSAREQAAAMRSVRRRGYVEALADGRRERALRRQPGRRDWP